jgi:signal transduction histidine kinase
MRAGGAGDTVGPVMNRIGALRAGGDWALALLLAGTSVLGVVLGGQHSWGRNEPVAILLALASTLPVAWRARRPLPAAALVLVANGACIYAAAPHQAAFQPFISLTLAAYSLGSRYEGAPWAAPALAVAALPVFAAAVAHGQSPGNAGPSYLWLVAAWTVGRTVREWRAKSLALERANRELADAAVAIERARIARELHDVVAHNVSMMVVQAGAAERVLAGEQPHVREALAAIAGTGRQTVDEMRTVLGVLRGVAPLAPQPGLADLEQLVAGVRDAGLPVTLRIEGEPRPLSQAADLSAYRIVQEALTNALKHAGPARAEVVVRFEAGAVALEVRDTGTGGGQGDGTGHGLVGMRERVAMFGGELEALPAPGGGFAVRARLPVGAAA